MTVAHTWYDRVINECDSDENMHCVGTGTVDVLQSRERHGTEKALIRIASLCNGAEFKPDQVIWARKKIHIISMNLYKIFTPLRTTFRYSSGNALVTRRKLRYWSSQNWQLEMFLNTEESIGKFVKFHSILSTNINSQFMKWRERDHSNSNIIC